jgi:hypothetical protein
MGTYRENRPSDHYPFSRSVLFGSVISGYAQDEGWREYRMKLFNFTSGAGSHERVGACQSCGWSLPLVRVSRAQRAKGDRDHTGRWMCEECVVGLTAEADHDRIRTSAGHADPVSHRSVA